MSESFLLKKKQEEEIQRLNAEFEAQLRVDKARYERKRQELEEQIAELEKKRLDTEIEKEKQHAMRSQRVLTGAATSTTSHKKGSAEASQEDGTVLSDEDVYEATSKFSDKSNAFSSSKYKPSRERSPSFDNSRYLFNRQRHRSSSAERDDYEFQLYQRRRDPETSSSQLPKLKLKTFDGNPLEWPEWSSMFLATVDKRSIPDSEKMSHLKTLLTGKARAAVSGMGYSGRFYEAAWRILDRKFGRPHVIVDAQLENLRKAEPVKAHDSATLINFSVIVSSFVNVLKEYKQLADLRSSSTLRMAVEKLPPILKEKWWFYVDEKDKDWPDLIMCEKWLGRMAFVLEGFSSFKDEKS